MRKRRRLLTSLRHRRGPWERRRLAGILRRLAATGSAGVPRLHLARRLLGAQASRLHPARRLLGAQASRLHLARAHHRRDHKRASSRRPPGSAGGSPASSRLEARVASRTTLEASSTLRRRAPPGAQASRLPLARARHRRDHKRASSRRPLKAPTARLHLAASRRHRERRRPACILREHAAVGMTSVRRRVGPWERRRLAGILRSQAGDSLTNQRRLGGPEAPGAPPARPAHAPQIALTLCHGGLAIAGGTPENAEFPVQRIPTEGNEGNEEAVPRDMAHEIRERSFRSRGPGVHLLLSSLCYLRCLLFKNTIPAELMG